MLNFMLDIFPYGTFIVWPLILEGSKEILKLGRSKNGYKKLKKSLSIWNKVSKWKYIKLSREFKDVQRFFVIAINLGYLCVLSLIFILIISEFTGNRDELMKHYLILKCYFVEAPALVLSIFNLKFTDRAEGSKLQRWGFEWRFIYDYKKRVKH